MECSHIRPRRAQHHAHVLNALRHQWNAHLPQPCPDTPQARAQRLTASMECSPPQAAYGYLQAAVLNALRHQWNAHAILDHPPAARSRRAQRLTASMECSREAWLNTAITPEVLNALRHQWNAHVARPSALPPLAGAQRLTASMECSPDTSFALGLPVGCSTPYGINGMLTCPCCGRPRSALVLNALRHQWNVHRICPNLQLYQYLQLALRDTHLLALSRVAYNSA